MDASYDVVNKITFDLKKVVTDKMSLCFIQYKQVVVLLTCWADWSDLAVIYLSHTLRRSYNSELHHDLWGYLLFLLGKTWEPAYLAFACPFDLTLSFHVVRIENKELETSKYMWYC
jgi:hypothetical protein